MLQTGVSWSACNPDEVVIARFFSRFQEKGGLDDEIRRINQFENCAVGTKILACAESDGRIRIIFCFETPVPASMVFRCTGLFRAVGLLTLPSNIDECRGSEISRTRFVLYL